MDKRNIFGGLSLLALAAVLFSPGDSSLWVWFLILGIIFGLIWLKMK